MLETRVQSLVREDPTCCGATKPVHQLLGLCSGVCSTTREATAMRSLRIATGEWPLLPATREKPLQQQRPRRAKNWEKKRSVPRSQAHPSSDPWAHSRSPQGPTRFPLPSALTPVSRPWGSGLQSSSRSLWFDSSVEGSPALP